MQYPQASSRPPLASHSRALPPPLILAAASSCRRGLPAARPCLFLACFLHITVDHAYSSCQLPGAAAARRYFLIPPLRLLLITAAPTYCCRCPPLPTAIAYFPACLLLITLCRRGLGHSRNTLSQHTHTSVARPHDNTTTTRPVILACSCAHPFARSNSPRPPVFPCAPNPELPGLFPACCRPA